MFITQSFIWFEYLPKATIGAWNCLFQNHSSNIDASDEDEDSGGNIISRKPSPKSGDDGAAMLPPDD